MTYLAIDPGKTTGWARFDSEGKLTAFGKIKGEDKFLDWLEEENGIEVAVIEQYRNRPGTQINTWSTGPTQQHIGAIRRVCRKRGWTVHFQEPSPCLDIGLRFLGLRDTYKGRDWQKHVPDDVAALAHGTYFLRKAGIQK
jgi:hypothetical protein